MRKNKIIAFFGIALAAVLVIMGINGRVTRTVLSQSGPSHEQKVNSVAFGFQLKQPFVPQHERLDTIRVHVDTLECAKETGELHVSILDENAKQAAFAAIPVSDLPPYGWADAHVNAKLVPGKVYTLVLESIGCVDNGPKITFLISRPDVPAEQKGFNLAYAGVEAENTALRAQFVYEVPIKMYEYSAYYAFGMMMALLML